jgi:hypothetical protein
MTESRLTQSQKQFVRQRARGCCEYCLSQAKFSPDAFSIEHIIPLSKEGSSDPDNLALACQGCNNFKYSLTEATDPITGESIPLFHPRQDSWNDHFIWSDKSIQMIGLTPTGRATIDCLRLNREGVVNLREVLQAIGQHPPQDLPSQA